MGYEWPAWEQDREMADRHARIIRRKLLHRAHVKAMVVRWLAAFDIPQRHTRGDAESFLMTHAGAGITEALGACLEALWREAWVLGAGTAAELSREAAGPSAVTLKAAEEPFRCDAGHHHQDRHGAAGLLVRHRDEHGKMHYLLHQLARGGDRGKWDLPGGRLHEHETPYDGAMREAREEIGTLPGDLRYHHKVTDHHGGWSYVTHVLDSPSKFMPRLNGSTPEETLDARWMTAREAAGVPMRDGLSETWQVIRESEQDTWVNTAMQPSFKARRNPVRAHGGEPAKLPADPWAVLRGQLTRAGIPAPMAGVLASAYETWLQGDAASAMQGILATLAGGIGEVLDAAREGLLTASEAVQVINEILDSDWKALRIAVTEVSRASAAAAQQVYILGRVTMVRWVTADDGRVCSRCDRNEEAGSIPLGDQFPSGPGMPPLHPNCRCAVVPVPVIDKPDGLDDIMKQAGKSCSNSWLASLAPRALVGLADVAAPVQKLKIPVLSRSSM